jgi:hypothetical protein
MISAQNKQIINQYKTIQVTNYLKYYIVRKTIKINE